MSVLRQIEVVSNQRNRNQDSSDRNRTHSLNEEALRKYVACVDCLDSYYNHLTILSCRH